MQLENGFEVDADPGRVWELLLDVPRVVPCMPGAELVDSVSDHEWRARIRIKLGPVALLFDATVDREEVDDARRSVRLSTQAREMKGRGTARAAIESTVTETASGTSVSIVTDVTLSGAVAQYGRGVVHDISAQLTDDFAQCLRRKLNGGPAAEAAPSLRQPAVGGLRLLLRALARPLARIFRRKRSRG